MLVSGNSQGQVSRIQLELPSHGTVTSADDIQVTSPDPCMYSAKKVAVMLRNCTTQAGMLSLNPIHKLSVKESKVTRNSVIHSSKIETIGPPAVGGGNGRDGHSGRAIACLVGCTHRACVCIGHPCLHTPGASGSCCPCSPPRTCSLCTVVNSQHCAVVSTKYVETIVMGARLSFVTSGQEKCFIRLNTLGNGVDG